MKSDSSSPSPIHIRTLLEASDGSVEDVRNLIALFKQETDGFLRELSDALDSGNLDRIRKTGHRGAGSSSVLGFSELEKSFRMFEFLSDSTDPINSSHYKTLLESYQNVCFHLDRLDDSDFQA